MILPDGRQVLLVHFLYQAPVGLTEAGGTPLGGSGDQTWKIACVPGLTEMHATGGRSHPWQRTNDVRATTCPNCMASAPYQRAKRELETALSSGRAVV